MLKSHQKQGKRWRAVEPEALPPSPQLSQTCSTRSAIQTKGWPLAPTPPLPGVSSGAVAKTERQGWGPSQSGFLLTMVSGGSTSGFLYRYNRMFPTVPYPPMLKNPQVAMTLAALSCSVVKWAAGPR